ncbi:MAG: IMP cyclohydrolase [Planctomycetes bacterium]|nr:IMP cyclohydrolase [Planctomycetota bacterium]
MYLGRIVAVGRNQAGECAAMYRVSSRSFPSRRAFLSDTGAAIIPKEGHEGDVFKNPYIAYNCCKLVSGVAVVTNGSHTDPIAEKIAAGMPIRDALALSMLAMDYEHDQLDTPRIAAVVTAGAETGFLAIVRKDGLNVHELPLAKGECYHVSTYEHNDILPEYKDSFNAKSAQECCDYVLGQGVFAEFLNPVSAVCACQSGKGFKIAAKDAEQPS